MARDESPPFDAMIPFHQKDSDILPYCIFGLRKNMRGLRNIYVVSREEPEDLEDAIWISEDRFPFTKADVEGIIKSTNNRHGWYLQQLLKLYAFHGIEGALDHILVFDADCVVCRPIELFNEQGQILFDWTHEIIYEPYFKHATAALGDLFCRVNPSVSGIREHMLFRRDILNGMLNKLEARHADIPAWKALLETVNPEEFNHSGMSEYELYFNYALKWFSNEHALRSLKRGNGISIRALAEGAHQADIIVFHAWVIESCKS